MGAFLLACFTFVMVVFCLILFSGFTGLLLMVALSPVWASCVFVYNAFNKESRIKYERAAILAIIVGAVISAIYGVYTFCTSDSYDMRRHRQDLTMGYWGPPPPPPIELVKEEVRRYELIGMNPPKHFYVSLEDVVTHQVYQSLYVSKHCNSYQNNKIGDEYNIGVKTFKQGERTWIEFSSLYAIFC